MSAGDATGNGGFRLKRYVPAAEWLLHYRREDLPGDLIAGTITAILLIPQAMAYSLLAGLPPEIGLYASIVPPIIYALFGSSRALAVGPVAVASLMVAAALGNIAPDGGTLYIAGALVLSMLVGLMLLVTGMLRMGWVANFLSHPVMSGFTSAAALLIAASQLKHLFGLSVPRGLRIDQTLMQLFEQMGSANGVAMAIGFSSMALLLFIRGPLPRLLKSRGMPETLAGLIVKAGPLVLVVVMTAISAGFMLHERSGLNVVGAIPAGLPPLGMPDFANVPWVKLLPSAALIALVSFVESVAVGRALASRRRQKIDANAELLGLGFANIAGAFSGASPVCGGFSRSVVNFEAGANTQLAAIVTASLIGLSLVTFAPALTDLPQAVLAAIIVIAVLGLVDLKTPVEVWRYDKRDGVALVVTFLAVLAMGIEEGIAVGVILSLFLYLWRTSRPHMAIVGRVGDSEHFRNIRRHKVRTLPDLLAVRVDESLYFANANYLEERLLGEAADNPQVRHVLLICSAVNAIDASALETLEKLISELSMAGVRFHLAEVKGPVMDKLEAVGFPELLKQMGGHIFLSTHEAFDAVEKGRI